MAQNLKEEMCHFYLDEHARRRVLIDILREYGIEIHPGPIGSSRNETDSHVVINIHPKLILELKNEIGSSNADPSLQALLYYDAFTREHKLWEDASTCHPCVVIFLAGQSQSLFGYSQMLNQK
jgi:hypothetical protein